MNRKNFLAVLMLAYSIPASANIFGDILDALFPSLDTMGTLEINCPQNNGRLVDHKFTTEQRNYKIIGECNASDSKNAYTIPYTVSANWDGKVAHEHIQIDASSDTVDLEAACPDDPWLNLVSCSLLSSKRNGDYETKVIQGASYPFSTNMIPEHRKKELQAELVANAAQEALNKICNSSQILAPQPASQTFFGTSHTITLKIKHLTNNPPSNWDVSFSNAGGGWPSIKKVTQIKTLGDTTTGQLKLDDLGSWKVTAYFKGEQSCLDHGMAPQTLQFMFEVKQPLKKVLGKPVLIRKPLLP